VVDNCKHASKANENNNKRRKITTTKMNQIESNKESNKLNGIIKEPL